MKELRTLLTLVMLIFAYRHVNSKHFKESMSNITNSFKKQITSYEEESYINFDLELNETDLFLDALGFKESSNRYEVTNRYGYLGKYQFSRITLRNLGYDVTKKEFLNSPELQERAMLDLLTHNKEILQSFIDRWDGQVYRGIEISESGILAAAHLAGPSRVKDFFRNGKDFKDGNGTRLTSYLRKFSGYKLEL
jgi:hypothetical protein